MILDDKMIRHDKKCPLCGTVSKVFGPDGMERDWDDPQWVGRHSCNWCCPTCLWQNSCSLLIVMAALVMLWAIW